MTSLLPALAMPYHDPDGRWITHLEAITPTLEMLFAHVYLGITHPTHTNQPAVIQKLEQQPFFSLSFNPPGTQAGDHCLSAYRLAAAQCPPVQVVHLAFLDRLTFALQARPEYRQAYLEAQRSMTPQNAPVLFMRSASAWETHPRNYRDCEWMAIRAGELLFGRTLDFFWGYFAATARQLAVILPCIHGHSWEIQAEIVLLLLPQLITYEVDWLAWEDPFFAGGDATAFKLARENSPAETRKRLDYVIPTLQILLGSSS